MPPGPLDHAEERVRSALDALLRDPAEGWPEMEAAAGGLEAAGRAAIATAQTPEELDATELRLLKQKGVLNLLLRSVGQLPAERRKPLGAATHRCRAAWGAALEERRAALGAVATRRGPALDLTLPGRRPFTGRPHILSQVRDELVEIFHGMGFSTYEGPEVEDDHHNFGALNFAPHHPARDAHDTLFVEGGVLLRTHTSPVQIRAMENVPPPLRMVFPGRVYRAEQLDPTHAAEFHQIEGLYVDRGVSMAHLKGTLTAFARAFLGAHTRTRFRPSYFPFTEPSGEMDATCVVCRGTGQVGTAEAPARCGACKGTGWLEILGCGMVHPNVFRAVGIDPEEWTGFAFGMGYDRIAMLRYGIRDIRYFLENDLRFLEQF
ncbi:MAG TPA: phenylalanine--tRNA ligase subunit alpha [Candidatus Saccharimonadales bacterium]|nr:phenylalanine--tRNA ligase subunit alpha [Candidatus Saccharimonadales bacterium]